MCAINATKKLRGVGNTPAPPLSAAKLLCSGRSPEHRAATVLDRAHEIPLMTTEPSGSWRKNDRLVHVIHYNPKSAFVRTHANGALRYCDFFPRVVFPPAHAK